MCLTFCVSQGCSSNAAVTALLGKRDFSLIQLQPEDSLAFGKTGTGWPGIYHWCRQAADQGTGSLSNNAVFDSYDLFCCTLMLTSRITRTQVATSQRLR